MKSSSSSVQFTHNSVSTVRSIIFALFLNESTVVITERAIYGLQVSIAFVNRLCGNSYEYATTDINLVFLLLVF